MALSQGLSVVISKQSNKYFGDCIVVPSKCVEATGARSRLQYPDDTTITTCRGGEVDQSGYELQEAVSSPDPTLLEGPRKPRMRDEQSRAAVDDLLLQCIC